MSKIKNYSKKTILITFVLLLVIAGGAVFYVLNRKSNDSQQTTQNSTEQDPINFDPPTKEDAQRVTDNKQKIVDKQEQQKSQAPTAPGAKQAVKPVITYAGQYGQAVEVGGYIGTIFEDGGTCTTTFTRSNVSFKKSVTAVKNANSVDCPVMSANTSEFSPKGSWTVSVDYSSAKASGTSDTRTIEIQ